MDNSNQLLHFLTAATSNLQEALSKPSNAKKVNHRRYIQKRLQKQRTEPIANTSSNKKKTKPSATPVQVPICNNNIRPHPVATSATPYWPTLLPQQPIHHYYTPALATTVSLGPSVTPPLSHSYSSSSIHSNSSSSGASSRPHSTQPPHCNTTNNDSLQYYDANLESLLTEIGLETSTSPHITTSQYNNTTTTASDIHCSTSTSSTLSRHSSLNTVHWDTYLPPNEFIPSPHSDFSDVDDSAYSSPSGGPSSNYYTSPIQQVCSPPNTTVSMTTTSYHHHVATGSCEWLPPRHHNTPLVTMPTNGTPSFLNITTSNLAAVPNTSLNEILELVTP